MSCVKWPDLLTACRILDQIRIRIRVFHKKCYIYDMTLIDTSPGRIREIRGKQARYFHSGATLDTAARKANLKALEKAVLKWEKPLCDALWSDLHKSYEEAYLTEISILLGEIRTHIRKIGKWTKPVRKPTPLPAAEPARETEPADA